MMITYIITIVIFLMILAIGFISLRIEKWKMQKKMLEQNINHAQDLMWYQHQLRRKLREPRKKQFKFGK